MKTGLAGKNHNRTDAEQDAWILADKRKRNKTPDSQTVRGFKKSSGNQIDLIGSGSGAYQAKQDGAKSYGDYNWNASTNRYEHYISPQSNYYSFAPEKKEEAPAEAPRSSGGGGGGGGSSSSSYPTNPSYGNTGNAQLNAQTSALQESISALVAAIANQQKAKAESVSEPAPGVESTILTPSMYDPTKEKKKKTYLTPLAVG